MGSEERPQVEVPVGTHDKQAELELREPSWLFLGGCFVGPERPFHLGCSWDSGQLSSRLSRPCPQLSVLPAPWGRQTAGSRSALGRAGPRGRQQGRAAHLSAVGSEGGPG